MNFLSTKLNYMKPAISVSKWVVINEFHIATY